MAYIKEKYGEDTLKQARSIEKLRCKIAKLRCDLKFIFVCKKNNLTPNFAKVELSIKMDGKGRRKITRTILDAEAENKKKKLETLQKKNQEKTTEIRKTLGFISFCCMKKHINNYLKNKQKKWISVNDDKLKLLFQNKSQNAKKGSKCNTSERSSDNNVQCLPANLTSKLLIKE